MGYLGVDLGTLSLRALLVDAESRPVASVDRSYKTRTRHDGWSEHDLRLWGDALASAVDEIRRCSPLFAELRGIVVVGHMHGATVLDQRVDVLRPCVLWNDTRACRKADPAIKSLSKAYFYPIIRRKFYAVHS